MDPFSALRSEPRKRLVPAPHPRWVQPMLATLTNARFSDDRWIFERKFDGERVLGFRNGREVRLLSRSEQHLEGTYPELVDALGAQDTGDFVVDGEVVAFEGGRTSFERLQGRLGITDPVRARSSPIRIYYYVFDLPHLDGYDTTGLPLRDRKSLLRAAITFGDPLRFATHRNGSGEAFLEDACRWGWEGLIAKRAESPYVPRRSPDWLKMKCIASQELVVVGFTDPAGSRMGFGALLVGYYENGTFRYAGKVGTGYTQETLVHLRHRLSALEQPEASVVNSRGVKERGVHWVRPEIVVQVAFAEWTTDGKLRQPRFEGLRTDKAPTEVVRERQQAAARGRT